MVKWIIWTIHREKSRWVSCSNQHPAILVYVKVSGDGGCVFLWLCQVLVLGFTWVRPALTCLWLVRRVSVLREERSCDQWHHGSTEHSNIVLSPGQLSSGRGHHCQHGQRQAERREGGHGPWTVLLCFQRCSLRQTSCQRSQIQGMVESHLKLIVMLLALSCLGSPASGLLVWCERCHRGW